LGFPKDHRAIRRCCRERDVLPPIKPYPAACRLSIGNLHRHRETSVPDTLAGAPEFEGTRGGMACKEGIEPLLMVGMMHGQRDTFLDATPQAKGHRIGLTDLMQRPVLIVGLQRQTSKLLHLSPCVRVANRLID